MFTTGRNAPHAGMYQSELRGSVRATHTTTQVCSIPGILITHFKQEGYLFKVPMKYNVGDVYSWHFELRLPFELDVDSNELGSDEQIKRYEESELYARIGGYRVEVVYVSTDGRNHVLLKNMDCPAEEAPTLVWYNSATGESQIVSTESVAYFRNEPKVIEKQVEKVIYKAPTTNLITAGISAAVNYSTDALISRLTKTPSNYALVATFGNIIKDKLAHLTPDDVDAEADLSTILFKLDADIGLSMTATSVDPWKRAIAKAFVGQTNNEASTEADLRLFTIGWLIGMAYSGTDLTIAKASAVIKGHYAKCK